MGGGTLIIDDAANGGSDAGAWHAHIANTPSLRVQCPDEFPGARPSGRTDRAPTAARSVTQTGGTGGTMQSSPPVPALVPPAPLSERDDA
jgi:hypothetical protein